MRLLRLRAVNFGPFAYTPLDLDLAEQGLVAVVGVNATDAGFDANGVGKSSILDALMWGLFGETSTRRESTSSDSGLKGDEIVNETVGKDCIVEVFFETTAKGVTRVRRWRKAKPDPDSKRGSGADVADVVDGVAAIVENLDKSNVQAEIDRRLGFDRALFSQTVVRGQEDTFTFAQATPKERFDILTQIEGLEELDGWDERFRARGRLLAHELAVLQGAVAGKAQTVAVYREQAARDAEAAARWEADRAARLGALEARRADATAAQTATQARLAAKAQYEARLAQIDQALAALVVPGDPPELTAWEQHAQALATQIAVARAERDRTSKQITRASEQRDGVCDACGQAVTPEHIAAHRARLEADAAAIDARIVEASTSATEAAGIIRSARQQVEQVRATVMGQRGQLDYERTTLLGAIGAARAEEGNLHRLNAQIVQLDADIAATRAAANPVVSSTDHAEALARLEAELATARDDEARKASEAGLCDWWVRNIPSLKAWIFDSVVGEITREANRWLAVLTGGLCWTEIAATSTTKAGDVRDRIALRCFRWNADGSVTEREFRQWSGGEKRRIALAIDWALAARLSQRAKGVCTFLALDEVDRHLDAAGRAGLLSALDILRTEKETVVVVTHDADMRAKPDVTWRVTKKPTGSVVEVIGGRKAQAQA